MKIIINKDLNKIIFFEELFGFRNSEWSKERKSEYTKSLKTKDLRKYRNKFLNVFSGIPSGLIESIFILPAKERDTVLKKEFGREKFIEIKHLIQELSKIFLCIYEGVWKDKQKKLMGIKRILEKDKTNIKKSIFEMSSFLKIKGEQKTCVKIYLVFGSNFNNDINAYFSSFNDKTNIFIDGYFVDNNRKNFSSLLVIHELIHILLRESKKINILKKFTKTNIRQIKKIISKNKLEIPEEVFFEELFISLFAPEGYFKENYYNKKTPKPKIKKGGVLKMKDLRKIKAYELKILVSNHMKDKMGFDNNFLKEIIKSGSNDPKETTVFFSHDEWRAFIKGVKTNEFNSPD